MVHKCLVQQSCGGKTTFKAVLWDRNVSTRSDKNAVPICVTLPAHGRVAAIFEVDLKAYLVISVIYL